MSQVKGLAITPDPARAIRRLCRHWSHKFAVQFDDLTGEIQINEVRVAMRATGDRLEVTLENPGGEIPQRLPGVVAEHLQRMAAVEPPLQVEWETASQS